jgi:hypothetical protein
MLVIFFMKMNQIKNTILAFVIGAGLSLFAGNAKAVTLLDFDFSVYGGTYNGGNNPSMTGKVFGLQDNATSSATFISILTMNGVDVNVQFMPSDVFLPGYDWFTVANGSVTDLKILAQRYGTVFFNDDGPSSYDTIPGSAYTREILYLNLDGLTAAGLDTRTYSVGEIYNTSTSYYTANSAITFTPASVPEPSALSLLAVGLGGLALIRRRK